MSSLVTVLIDFMEWNIVESEREAKRNEEGQRERERE